MKRLFAFLLTLLLIFCFAGCAPSGYLKSSDGDLNITLPDNSAEGSLELTDTAKALLGEWELAALTSNGTPISFSSGLYLFSDEGFLEMNTSGINGMPSYQKLSFYCKEGNIYVDKEMVKVTVTEDIATITTASNTVHVLKKIASTESSVPAE